MYAPLHQMAQAAGQFVEKTSGKVFEYSRTAETPFPGYDRKVWVGDITGQGFRWARVLKTRAHVVVDEGPDGEPVVELFLFRHHTPYN